LVGALALVALLGAACGGDDGGDGGGAASGGAGGGSAVTLTAKEFAWDPGTLTAPAGSSVDLVNEDEAKHNLTIEDAGVDEDVDGGETVTVDLGDLEAGSYEFVCEYHPDTMTGTLEVE
ncbi:MAG: cupredoxin domain-containing protein, partial [Actinomycetota bacterium]|nr:cupredoxin domain-containing protein [Actinomycetota bacterium]